MTTHKEMTNRLPPVEDDQMDSVADWEMARALYADTFNYPINKNEEWTKLIHGPDWIKAEGFKRMARKCREALEARNLKIVNASEYPDQRPPRTGKELA